MDLNTLNPVNFFIQIGANDGITDDPLYHLIRQHHWRGLLVEPLPDIFEKLKLNYATEPQLDFANVAITNTSGTVEFWRHPKYPQCSGLGVKTRMQQKVAMEKVVVEGLTFRELCGRHNVKQVDLLQIDTEGFDFEIIKLIPWDIFVPKLIRFEHKHLDKGEAYRYLRQLGYDCFGDQSDTISLLVDSTKPPAAG